VIEMPGQYMPRDLAVRLQAAITAFMREADAVAGEGRSAMSEEEWQRLGRALGRTVCLMGDELLVPIYDAHPELDREGLPPRPEMVRTWGPRAT
jgi:hypothetical protein